MRPISLDLFTEAVYDFERAQYQILSSLQATRKAFAQNVLYPHLADLIQCYGTIRAITQQSEDLRSALPKRIRRVDLESGDIEYEQPDLNRDQVQAVEELMHWALPHLQEAIEEGRMIFEFVDEHLHLEEVGLVPSYVQEGYLLIPDPEAASLHILQYTLSIFTGADARYRSLKTAHLKSLPQGPVEVSPRSIKLSLMEERRELPNPATYFFGSDLGFPYEATVLPIAKRKLMRHLYGEA